MTHIDYLLRNVPDLAKRRILDVGSGRGGFLVDAASRGFSAVGIEINPLAITRAHERAQKADVSITVIEGSAEALPFPDSTFDFANVCEVLEHVPHPGNVLGEVSRVLAPGGRAYVTMPNRFGFYDPHYHTPLVNWLPRFLSEPFLFLLGRQKEYTHGASGRQKLTDMHYYTKGAFERLCNTYGLTYADDRERLIARLPFGVLLLPLYRAYAFLFISTFHGIVEKNATPVPHALGDELLARDAEYLVPKGGAIVFRGPWARRPHIEGEVYLAYPSATLPRFLIPSNDTVALAFALRMMSVPSSLVGALLRILLQIPGGIWFLSRVVFRECIVISSQTSQREQNTPAFSRKEDVSVIDELRALVKARANVLVGGQSLPSDAPVSVTKFCQRIAGKNTKVLFLLTHQGVPLCIIKMMRDASGNDKLKREKEAQEQIATFGACRVPSVYFDAVVGGRYVYAEQPLVFAEALSPQQAWKREREIVECIRAFPASSLIPIGEIAKVLMPLLSLGEPRLTPFLEHLRGSDVSLKKGLTHGDLGSPNILREGETLYIIDWEQANRHPYWLFDAVYLMARLRRIGTLLDWQKRCRRVFCEYTRVDESTADTLFSLVAVLGILRKRYPDQYTVVVEQLARVEASYT